jgi:hypothetical protein
MKNIIGSLLRAGAVAGAILCSAPRLAAEPGAVHGTAPVTGRVLVLDNEHTLTGDIERDGDEYRIKRLAGETRVPVGKALRLCASLEEAYQYLRTRANLRDPDERMRLADWCRQHGLKEQALAEVEEAGALKPGDARIARMLSHLREQKAKAAAPPAPPRPEAPALPRVDVTAETLGQFATRVQPILMNACVSCHSAGRGGSFQLTRVGGGLHNRKALEHNLAMVMSQVSARDPRTSRLLVKAVSLHGPGMSQPPLKGKEAPAYRHLEGWVFRTLENNPHLVEQAVAAAPVAAPPPSSERPRTGMGWGEDRGAKPPAPPVPVAAAPPPVVPPAPGVKEGPKKVTDPLDPEAFNREFHPERKGGAEGEKDKR